MGSDEDTEHRILIELRDWHFEFEPEATNSGSPDLSGLRLRATGKVVLPGRTDPVNAEVLFIPRTLARMLEADVKGKATFHADMEVFIVRVAIPEPMWRQLWDKAAISKAASIGFWIYDTKAELPDGQTLPISDVELSLGG